MNPDERAQIKSEREELEMLNKELNDVNQAPGEKQTLESNLCFNIF